jgi:RNA polymerase primary sigma factor
LSVVRRLETLAADAETLQAYLRQIAGLPRLTASEEQDLARRVRQQGDEQALSRLVESNLRMVVSYAGRFRHLGVPALDLIHEGNLGLIEAGRRFDPDAGLSFIAHAFWWVRQAMLHLLATAHAEMLRDGDNLEGSGKGLHIAALQAAIEYGPVNMHPSMPLDGQEDEGHPAAGFVSGTAPWSGHRSESDEPPAEGSVLVLHRPPDADDQLTRDAVAHAFEAQLAYVDPRARQILRLRHGLHGGEAWTVEQVAIRLGLSPERVDDVEADARHALSRQRSLESHLN